MSVRRVRPLALWRNHQRRHRCRNTGAAGFVLIVVIWLIALLALVSGAYMRSVQAHVRSSAARVQLARAELAADSGFSLAVLDVLDSRLAPGRERRFPANGQPVSCQLDSASQVAIGVQDAGGRVNLNTASERLLTTLFLGLGVSPEVARQRAETLLDFRDADDARRPNGAELPEYVVAGRLLGPKNAPFDSISELGQVLGFDAGVVAEIEPHVTIHSATAGLDPAAVTPALAAIIRRGTDGLTASSRSASDIGGLPAEFTVSSNRRVYIITVTGQVAGAAMFVREAVVEVLGNRDGLPVVKVWTRASSRRQDLDLTATAPC